MTIRADVRARVIELHLQGMKRDDIKKSIGNISTGSVSNIIEAYKSSGENGTATIDVVKIQEQSELPASNMATIRTASDIKKVGSPLLMTCHGSGTGQATITTTNSSSNVVTPRGPLSNLLGEDNTNHTSTDEVIPLVKFADTINEPVEIRKVVINQLMSAKDEILLLFSTSNSFYRAKYDGMLNLLRQIPNDVTVKVLIQAEDNLQKETIQDELRQSLKQIRVQFITKPLQTRIVALVVDQATSVAIDINDDTKKTFEEASGPAIYSNNETTVASCISIFETLWIQSELDKQNKIKEAYLQMFKGLKFKDETYLRRWSLEQKKIE